MVYASVSGIAVYSCRIYCHSGLYDSVDGKGRTINQGPDSAGYHIGFTGLFFLRDVASQNGDTEILQKMFHDGGNCDPGLYLPGRKLLCCNRAWAKIFAPGSFGRRPASSRTNLLAPDRFDSAIIYFDWHF